MRGNLGIFWAVDKIYEASMAAIFVLYFHEGTGKFDGWFLDHVANAMNI